MRLTFWFTFILAAGLSLSANAETPADDALSIYGVNVTKGLPFHLPFIGYGIYLGRGKVITAAHVVGDWPAFTNPHVLVAGLSLPVEVLKIGSLDTTDLALLSVDETQLPINLRLRRNPICERPLQVGANVIVVYPQRTVATRIVSPLLIAPQYRSKFGPLIAEEQGSGSGVFDAERKCLLGIISRKVQKYSFRNQNGRATKIDADYAGIFVSASTIAKFLRSNSAFRQAPIIQLRQTNNAD